MLICLSRSLTSLLVVSIWFENLSYRTAKSPFSFVFSSCAVSYSNFYRSNSFCISAMWSFHSLSLFLRRHWSIIIFCVLHSYSDRTRSKSYSLLRSFVFSWFNWFVKVEIECSFWRMSPYWVLSISLMSLISPHSALDYFMAGTMRSTRYKSK